MMSAQRKRAKRRKTDRPRILPRIHGYAIERFQKRIKELLPLVSIRELARALTKLDCADFKTAAQEQVVKAYRTIFYKTDSEPESASKSMTR